MAGVAMATASAPTLTHPKSSAVEVPRDVALQVEVYDPVTNFVWEGVGVRIVEGAMEWSGCTCPNPNQQDWYFTGFFGTVSYDAGDLAEAQIGFMEDAFGRAVLSPHPDEDEAFVLIELAAPGLNGYRESCAFGKRRSQPCSSAMICWAWAMQSSASLCVIALPACACTALMKACSALIAATLI